MAKCVSGSCEIPWLLLHLALVCTAGLQQISNPRIVEHPEDQFVARNEPATLNCKAEGEPPPIITWYRNGQPVSTANENPLSHRMLLPSGQLFFLRIIHNKNMKPDVGVYYCNATNPETRISVISKNATLEMAVIGNEFREQPKSAEVAVGSDAVLDCKPPKGEPEPKIRWRKDNDVVKVSDRITISETGSLRIKDVRKDDGGVYFCIAYNIGGEKDSIPARLAIREKPRIVEGPKDVLVQENLDVFFHCRAIGDPEPTIIWKKVDDQMPQGRLHILEDRSLKIERARQSDEGTYTCRAENSVGWLEAEAKLTVHSQPSFVVTPTDKTVGIGRRATFRCEVTGNPLPTVFWNKEASQTLMFPNQDHGRISVSEDGTLIIESVQKEDAGEYICKGLSIAGSAYAKAKLEVKEVDSRPPPIIHHGPQNQTLPINTLALLHCSASGEPVPLIRWYKNGRILPVRDPRFSILDSGTLQISDLRKTDTGMYTCKAISETGETAWSAALIVETPTNPSIIFHRTPEPTTFPGPPSKPSVSDVTETSVRLTWKPNSNHGASAVYAYTVEYFSHETGEGWIVASGTITEPSFVVRSLRPDTAYMFLVRAQNSHGLSLPSHVTAPVRTKGDTSVQSPPSLPPLDLSLVAEKLSGQIVTMLLPEAMSSTAVKLSWEVRRNQRFVEGFHIRYRAMPTMDDQVGGGRAGVNLADWTVETVQSNTATMYTLHNLERYTWYEINIQPFYSTVIGQESNIVRVRTFEDVPSAPPHNIQVKMVDNSTIYLTWEPPPKRFLNGVLRGYKIYMYGSEAKYDKTISTNASMDAVFIHQVLKDMTYKIHLSAHNRMGEGVRSDPIFIGPQIAQKNIVKEPWFVATLIGVIGGGLWLVLCVLSVWLYRRRKGCKKMPRNIHPSVAVYKPHDCLGNGTVMNEALEPTYQPQKDAMCSTKEVQYINTTAVPSLQSSAGLKTFYNKAHLATPYATTNLLPNGGTSIDQSAFKPIQHSYMIQQDGRNSIDSGVKHDISSTDSNENGRANAERPLPDGFYHQLEPCDFAHSPISEYGPLDNTGLYGHQHPIHPVLFLPPPPQHPPPNDTGTLPSYSSCMENEMKSQNMDQRKTYTTRDPRRQVLEPDRSRSYAPNDPQRNNCSTLGHSMHEADARNCVPMPPRHAVESQIASQNSRVYSPHAMSEPEYGPSTANRAYKLVPIRDNEIQRHFSDNEGAPVPAFRMMMSHEYSPPSPAPEDPMMDCEMQNLVGEPGVSRGRLQNVKQSREAATKSPDSPISEVGMHDCRGLDGYLEVIEPRPRGGSQSPQHSFSDNEEGLEAGIDPAAPLWIEGAHDSDTNCSSIRSSAASSDGSFQAKLDFASAVAKAAQMSGLTVVNAPPLTSISAKDREKVKKASKHRQRARCTSPYSTDSNYSSVNVPHRPYPKSERRRQLRDQQQVNQYKTQPNDFGLDEKLTASAPIARPSLVLAKSQSLKQDAELPLYNKPCFPNGPGTSRVATTATGQKLMPATAPSSGNGEFDVSPHSNPVTAFDTHADRLKSNMAHKN